MVEENFEIHSSEEISLTFLTFRGFSLFLNFRGKFWGHFFILGVIRGNSGFRVSSGNPDIFAKNCQNCISISEI